LVHWIALHGVTVHRMLTDNGVDDRSRLFGVALADTGTRARISPQAVQAEQLGGRGTTV
jgi:hypothetical protein